MMKRKAMAITLTAAMLAGLTAVPAWAEDAVLQSKKNFLIFLSLALVFLALLAVSLWD